MLVSTSNVGDRISFSQRQFPCSTLARVSVGQGRVPCDSARVSASSLQSTSLTELSPALPDSLSLTIQGPSRLARTRPVRRRRPVPSEPVRPGAEKRPPTSWAGLGSVSRRHRAFYIVSWPDRFHLSNYNMCTTRKLIAFGAWRAFVTGGVLTGTGRMTGRCRYRLG